MAIRNSIFNSLTNKCAANEKLTSCRPCKSKKSRSFLFSGGIEKNIGLKRVKNRINSVVVPHKLFDMGRDLGHRTELFNQALRFHPCTTTSMDYLLQLL